MSISEFVPLGIYFSIIGKDNIKYIDEDDIGKYVDYIFEDILPDYYFNP